MPANVERKLDEGVNKACQTLANRGLEEETNIGDVNLATSGTRVATEATPETASGTGAEVSTGRSTDETGFGFTVLLSVSSCNLGTSKV